MLKKLGRGLCSLTLKLALFFLALVAAGSLTFGTPTVIKKALADSKLYETLVTSGLDTAQKELEKKPAEPGELPLNLVQLRQAAQAALPPSTIQESSEAAIDGIYNWLNGKTKLPEFKIDLTKAKTTFANEMANYVEQRYVELPPCGVDEMKELRNKDVDPFTVPCQVPGTNVATVKQEVLVKLQSSNEVFGDPVITSDKLKNAEGQNVFEKAEQAPKLFQLVNKLPLILGTVAVLSAACLVLLHDKRLKGLKNIGVILIGTGLFLLLSTLLMTYLFNQVNAPGGALTKVAQGQFQASILAIAKSVNDAYNAQLIKFCVGYMILGVLILVGLWIYKKRNGDEPKPVDPVTPEETTDKPAKPESKPLAETKPSKKKIQ